ncbi:predicted protein [Uncinocarpus reesii 1704]|uniref:Aminoglycoside phosphotransferase domain-containing protein n=1 Tax=Uncinocarpus reesii (strain UAMH 1704) TaxID=336963 RepID=C4JMH5_UNCRE|nr:uncharacterized protein UREG_04033 [Uncinocarpus reesii 1704]EEP79187.1 predicted protein [Uncinocarpus reesii 1704]
MAIGDCPTISSQALPPAESATFLKSSFFSRNGPGAELPSPANVREQGAVQDPASKGRDFGFQPVRYEQLGLIVKYGRAPQVTVAEGQSLWALRRVLPAVPVPEVYGWTHDNGQVFIYMELVKGVTLEQRWEFLDQTERVEICEQLRVIILELRKVRHAPGDFFLDPYRNSMPDDAEVVFTHADLHPSNILVSEDSPSKISAIIDWRQSGWYPDYWEFCKAQYTADVHGEWMNVYISLFLNEPSCLEAWEFYARSFGY